MEDPENVIRSIAIVNAKKLPGVTRGAYAPTIMYWYGRGADIIRRQIEACDPHIVFGCSPHFPAIIDSFGMADQIQTFESANYAWSESRLFVHVYHPGQTQITREKYVDDALGAVSHAMSDKQNPA